MAESRTSDKLREPGCLGWRGKPTAPVSSCLNVCVCKPRPRSTWNSILPRTLRPASGHSSAGRRSGRQQQTVYLHSRDPQFMLLVDLLHRVASFWVVQGSLDRGLESRSYLLKVHQVAQRVLHG